MIQTLKNVKEYKEELIRPDDPRDAGGSGYRQRLKARHESSHQAQPRYGEEAGGAGNHPSAGGKSRGGMAPGAGH